MAEEKTTKKGLDWSRFGLSSHSQQRTPPQPEKSKSHSSTGTTAEDPNIKDLFEEDQGETLHHTPWWKANFFIREPVLFGTWDGVFTSCLLNIFGVVIFLRTGWMVGNAGIGLALLIVLITLLVALAPALSAIGVCERCHVQAGGVFFLLSYVLGGRIGGTVGIMYTFGQAAGLSLYSIGFGESLAELTNWDSPWAIRCIALITAAVMLVVVIAGVKWVVKLQLLLLAILAISVLDFIIGTFTHTDYAAGFTGYRSENMEDNAVPEFSGDETFFTVFGVFFPTATGVMAGINMSGDLKDPSNSIPTGTLAAMGVSGFLYIVFVLLIGAVCTRHALLTDYMVASKVSLVGVLFLCGLYISSLSSCLGAQYGAPRVLQSICKENIIPVIRSLGKGRGPNKEPFAASIAVFVISCLLILVGNLNDLAPVVTMPFLITYAAIDYAYFKLAMSYDIQERMKIEDAKLYNSTPNGGGRLPETNGKGKTYGTNGTHDLAKDAQAQVEINEIKEDKDSDEKDIDNKQSEEPAITDKVTGYVTDGSDEGTLKPQTFDDNDTTHLLAKDSEKSKNDEREKEKDRGPKDNEPQIIWEIDKQPNSYYSNLCNRWVSLTGAFFSLLIMFLIHWGYALANISFALLIYIYIGQANPGVSKGIADDFLFHKWIQGLVDRARKQPRAEQQMVIPQDGIPYGVSTYQLTEDNTDFSYRSRYHQSSVMKTNIP